MDLSLRLTSQGIKKVEDGTLWLTADFLVGRKPAFPAVARLIDARGRVVAVAFYSPSSFYSIKVIAKGDVKIDRGFWREKILKADLRREPLKKITNAYRMVYAESDGIPSVNVDRYNDIIVIEINSDAAASIKDDLAFILMECFSPKGILVKLRFSSAGVKAAEDLIVHGDNFCAKIFEADQGFEVDLLNSQKTGGYLDYRGFRLKMADWADGLMLDGFCNQGWLSCHAAGIAKRVIAVDSSRAAIEAAKVNSGLNGHKNIVPVLSDIFEYLKNSSDEFDFIHLDPPAFAKGRGVLQGALRGYERLVKHSLPRLKIGGKFFISSCSQAVTERILEETVVKSAKKNNRNLKPVWMEIQDNDHPILKGHSQSLYLKGILFEEK